MTPNTGMQLISASPKKIGGKITYQTPLLDPIKSGIFLH